ncbi:MAG: YkuS family protein [Bacillota bacterium]
MKKVAVERGLENIKSFLSTKGYTVTDLDSIRTNLDSVDAIVVSGQDTNFLGMQDTTTRTAVINAKGMSAEDVHSRLKNRLS